MSEGLNVKFCKYLLQVHKKATNAAVLGELGRFPLYVKVFKHVVKYWHRLAGMPENSILRAAANESKNLYLSHQPSWIGGIEALLASSDLGKYFNEPSTISGNNLAECVSKRAKDEFIEYWKGQIDPTRNSKMPGKISQGNGGKLRTYKCFKNIFGLEKYLINVKNSASRASMTRFRISAHELMIEKGRYLGLNVNDRQCPVCKSDIEDEIHFFANCTHYQSRRKLMFDKISNKCSNFTTLSDRDKVFWLMNNEDSEVNILVANFIRECFESRKSLLNSDN